VIYIVCRPNIINKVGFGGKVSFSRFVGILTVFLVFLVLFSAGALALTGPRLYIQEQVTGSYFYDGTVETDTTRTGQVLISVPNNDDVLQYIRANLTGTDMSTRTNLKNSTAFRNVQYSPNANETAGIYVNTTANDPDTSYSISSIDYGPTINLSMTWNNSRNGDDLFPDDNLEVSGGTAGTAQNIIMFNFTATNPSSVIDLNGSEVAIYFATDYGVGGRDVVNLSAGTNVTSSGTASLATADADNDWDTITWTGNITAGSTIYFTVNGTIEEGDNFLATADAIDLDSAGDAGGNGNYSNSSTFTGITSDYKFARSSIRTGIDLSQGVGGYWDVRGFIRNVATTSSELGGGETGLVYNVTEWRIYSVDPSTGVPYSAANQTGEFNKTPGTTDLLYPDDGRVYTNNATRSSNTSWFNSSTTTKPYFSSYFDWHVVWDTDYSNTHMSYVNTTMNLPDLYKVDLAHTKTHTDGYISPDTGGEPIWLDDNVTFAGDENAAVRYFQINSVIPANTTNDEFHGNFTINHTSVDDTPILLYFVNDSAHLMNISDSSFSVSVTNPASDGTENGTITVTIWDVRNAALEAGGVLGDDLNGSEYFSLRYQLISHPTMTTGDVYRFTGNTSVATVSGTNYTQPHLTADVNIGGKRLTGYKELKVYDTSNPTLINASLLVEVESGGVGISGIKFMDYVPSSVTDYTNFVNNFSNGDFSVWFYNISGWHLWVYGSDYDITSNGTYNLNDGTEVHAFEFVNATGNSTWTLNDGEKINVSYQMNVTVPGTYILPLELAGFDPETGQEFRAVTYGFIRVDIPVPDLPLHVTESDLAIAKRVVVGNPALWVKEFEVFNPNPRQVASRFETDVFVDAMEAYVSYYDEAGQKVERKMLFGPVSGGKKTVYWDDVINALETRSYELRVLTPPVMEIDRDVEVLEKLPDKRVKLKMDVYLKSFAEEDYSNVVLNLPVSYEDAIEARDGFGNRLEFTGGGESTTIFVNDVAAGDIKTVTVIYRESYPTIIVTPDRDRYNLNSPVGLEILVINGGETVEYPYIELEIYTPGMDVIFTNMEKLQSLEPLEKTEMFERFVVPMSAPTGMYIASAKFREDFVTLASATGNFYIVGAGGGLPEALEILMILVVSGVLLYFSFRRLKETRKPYSGSFERGGF
jgi:hypothetical protein